MAILTGNQIEQKITALLNTCKSFSIVVAWATENSIFTEIKKNIKKADLLIIGIDFFQTSPRVLDWLKNNTKNIAYIRKKPKGVFHPKVYLFKIADGTTKIVTGSANLTKAAFSENEEFCISIDLSKESTKDSQNIIGAWEKNSTAISKFNLQTYADDYNTKGREIRKLARVDSSSTYTLHPDLLNYDFDEYYNRCCIDPHHSIKNRLSLLDSVLTAHTNHDDFISMAGIKNASSTSRYSSYDGFFGGMSQDKAFMQCVRDPAYHQLFINLMNGIPQGVGRVDFQKFVIDLNSIINNSSYHIKKINFHFSAATRLLSFKRPDIFFCLNSGNGRDLADDLTQVSGQSYPKDWKKNTPQLKMDLYWDAIQLFQNSKWGSSKINPRWSQQQKDCWKGRIAMIDSLYY